IDLGEWAAEEKRIAGEPVDSESDIDYDHFLQ
ncbi:MAG: DNA gyrase inhibitor YacG, partial [Methylococcales bacterium]|nr:DNA gyrase inhibitor YacG [Methylococcales bacterium]